MKNKIIKRIITATVISLFFAQIIYTALEPDRATAATAPDTVVVTLNVTSGLTLSDGANATMTPNIGIASNQSIGSSSWVATTNSATGYTLAVKASTTPALKNGAVDNFADYTEAVGGTPDVWGGVTSGTKEFGYSVNSLVADVPTGTWGTATTCGNVGTGVPDALGKYRGFTTSDVTVASRATVTPVAGVTTNICFAAQQNGVFAASGAYTATITATMTAS